MKKIILKGVEVTVGSRVRYINDKDLYVGINGITKPELGKIYSIRAINELDGFLLKEIRNVIFEWYSEQGELEFIAEPGFANWRFEPVLPISKKKVVRIEILPEVEERLDTQKVPVLE